MDLLLCGRYAESKLSPSMINPILDRNMPETFTYAVAKSFTRFPGGRRRKHGDHSGEEFRESVLLPLLAEHEYLVFDLGGSAGYSSGFLDEAFGEIGALIGVEEAIRRIKFLAIDDPEAVDTVWQRIHDASSERRDH